MSRWLPAVREAALTALAIAGTLCLLAAFAAVALGIRPLVVQSGSMSPVLEVGALAVTRSEPASAIRVGQVVTVPWENGRVTHRVVSVVHLGRTARLRLRGDADPAADPQPYDVTSARRVLFAVPVLGRVIAWLGRPPGIFVLAALAAVLLLSVVRRDGPDGDGPALPGGPGGPRHRSPAGSRHRTGVALAAGATALAVGFVVPAWASGGWSDTVTVRGLSLATGDVTAPDGVACTASTPTAELGPPVALSQAVTVTWSAANGTPVAYRAYLVSGTLLDVALRTGGDDLIGALLGDSLASAQLRALPVSGTTATVSVTNSSASQSLLGAIAGSADVVIVAGVPDPYDGATLLWQQAAAFPVEVGTLTVGVPPLSVTLDDLSCGGSPLTLAL